MEEPLGSSLISSHGMSVLSAMDDYIRSVTSHGDRFRHFALRWQSWDRKCQ